MTNCLEALVNLVANLSDKQIMLIQIYGAAFAGICVATIFVYASGRSLLSPFGTQITKFSRCRGGKKAVCMMLGVTVAAPLVVWVLTPSDPRAGFFAGMISTRWAHIGDLEKILGQAGQLGSAVARGRSGKKRK